MKRPKSLLTARQAAERLGISTQRIYQLAKDGKLPAWNGAIGNLLFAERTINARAKLLRTMTPSLPKPR